MTLEAQLVVAVQARLSDLGYYRVRIDGVPGPATSAAIVRFKEAVDLRARDFVGPITLMRLFAQDAPVWSTPPARVGEPPWLTEARAHVGLREAPGKANNPTLMQMARDLDQWYPGDDVPWCGLFAAHCMAVGAPDEPQRFNRLGARNWLEYGVDALDRGTPGEAVLPLGGVAVFWRTHPTKSWHGHVAPAITGQNRTHVRVIGGNQSDSVSEAWFPRSRLLGVRKPEGAVLDPAPTAPTGRLSTSEA